MKDYTFTMTDQHLALLRQMNVGWNDVEFGAPEIDPKRPYGNSDVLEDMAEILGLDAEADEEVLRRLHNETETALQIVLAVGEFVAGRYHAPRYTSDWLLARRACGMDGEG